MATNKKRDLQISVFKGRENKLNRAIFQILVGKDPKTIWEITKQVKILKGLKRTRYHNINSRVKALEADCFLRRVGEKETKTGGKSALFETTEKAVFALLLDSISIDKLIKELDEVATLSLISQIATR